MNLRRLLLGGIAAGMLIWILEGVASMTYLDAMQAALAAHGLEVSMNAGIFMISVAVSLISGLALVFFYAASRPRFGAGPRTAVLVAVVLWIGGYLLSLTGYGLIGLYPIAMLAKWGVIGLVEMILASLLGAWIYRERVL